MPKVKEIYSRIAPASKSQINVKNEVLENLLKDIKQKIEKQQKEHTSFRKTSFDNDKKIKVQLQKIEKQQKELQEQNRVFMEEQMQQNELLKRILLMLENDETILKQNHEVSKQTHEVSKQTHEVSKQTHEVSKQTHEVSKQTHEVSRKTHEVLGQIHETLKGEQALTEKVSKAADEAVWGLTFNNAVSDSKWLLNRSFYPGRWAVGYQYLYVLFRVLNEYKPNQILELGLGQSTHMITQYTAKFEEVRHRVVEHDEEWIRFFRKEHSLTSKSEIVQLNLDKEEFLEDPEVLVYQGFGDKLGDKKYDFISVDAPFGGQAKVYARIDILKIIPECLEDSFVIMVDDANRKGEQQTIRLIKEKLEENGIEYSFGSYKGNKETYIITSIDNKFLCTM